MFLQFICKETPLILTNSQIIINTVVRWYIGRVTFFDRENEVIKVLEVALLFFVGRHLSQIASFRVVS